MKLNFLKVLNNQNNTPEEIAEQIVGFDLEVVTENLVNLGEKLRKTYEVINIKEGDEASRMFVEIFVKGKPAKNKDQVRKDLEDYCHLDTQAMIDIVNKLNVIVKL